MNERFLMLYQDLEKWIKLQEGISQDSSILPIVRSKYKEYVDEIEAFRNIRNLLAHDRYSEGNERIEVSKHTIVEIETILNKIKNPKTVFDICVPFENVLYASLDDVIESLVDKMTQNSIEVIPILHNKRVIGVFSENTLIRLLATYGKQVLKFSLVKVKDEVTIEADASQYYAFVSRNELAKSVRHTFRNVYRDNKRLSLVFINENGKTDEKLLGIVNIWDVLDF